MKKIPLNRVKSFFEIYKHGHPWGILFFSEISLTAFSDEPSFDIPTLTGMN